MDGLVAPQKFFAEYEIRQTGIVVGGFQNEWPQVRRRGARGFGNLSHGASVTTVDDTRFRIFLVIGIRRMSKSVTHLRLANLKGVQVDVGFQAIQ